MLNWKDLTIGRAIRQGASEWGDNEALAWSGGKLSYARLFNEACKLAWGLRKTGIENTEEGPVY